MKIVEEVIKLIQERRYKLTPELLDDICRQAIICGEVTIKFNSDQTFEIVNPFKGCTCD